MIGNPKLNQSFFHSKLWRHGEEETRRRGDSCFVSLCLRQTLYPPCLLVFLSLYLLLFSSAGLAQQLVLTATSEGETVTFTGDRNIRYFADYEQQTILLPDARIPDANTLFPSGFKVYLGEKDITIKVGGVFRVTLSSNERTLTIVRGETLGSTPTQIAGDKRAPIMYYLSNAKAGDVAGMLKSIYGNIQIEVDERQRALLVMVTEEDRELVDNLIASLDRPRPQVMFEAEILEINQDISESLGINYDSIFSFKLDEADPKGLISLGDVARNPLSFNISINALKTNGAAQVLARPRVTTMDGVAAQINATQTTPLVIPGATGQQSVQNITTGIKLSLTARISPDGMVEADIAISVSSPTGITSQSVPTYSSRDATTTVRVANGEPIAIGGLFEKRKLEGKQKVPILGDLPLIGALFTSTSYSEKETDLVIVVTPRIVDMPDLQTVSAQGAMPAEVVAAPEATTP
jgi:general secretion pathway protein D